MTQNEAPAVDNSFEIRLTPSLVSFIEGTDAYQGKDAPEVEKELHSLKYTKKGASGSVSLSAMGWLLDQIGSRVGDDVGNSTGERKAAQKFLDDWHVAFWVAKRTEEEKAAKKAKAVPAADFSHAPPAEVSAYGKPVYHVRTRKLVGYLYQGPDGDKWTPIEEVKSA